MVSDLITAACLAAYLPAVFLLHIAWYRWNPGLKSLPAQGPAAKVVAVASVIVLGCVGALIPRDNEWLSHLVFAALALVSLATFYFTFLCVSESGRRYYLLSVLQKSGTGLSRQDLLRIYGKEYMIEIRLARLVAWRVVERMNDRLILRKKTFYISSMCFYLWARMLDYRWFPEDR